MRKKQYLMITVIIIVILVTIFILQFMVDAGTVNKFKIGIEKVRLADIGVTSCDLWITINCINPTNQDLSIKTATFDVYVAQSFVGKSNLSKFSIPHQSSREQEILLTLLYSDIAHAVVEGIQNKNFDINISGHVQGYVFFGLFTVSVPFSVSSIYP